MRAAVTFPLIVLSLLIALAICRATGRPPTADTPRSPCSMPAIQSPYCAASGLSKPNSARSDAMRSGVAFVPAMTAATSPGNTRSITNTNTDRPIRAATNSISRFPTNRMIVHAALPTWFSRSATAAARSDSACWGSLARACWMPPSRGSRTASPQERPR